MCTGADDFLPVLIYVVIHANPPQLASNLEYIQRFRMHSRMVSESAYFFTQLVCQLKPIYTSSCSDCFVHQRKSPDGDMFSSRDSSAVRKHQSSSKCIVHTLRMSSMKCQSNSRSTVAAGLLTVSAWPVDTSSMVLHSFLSAANGIEHLPPAAGVQHTFGLLLGKSMKICIEGAIASTTRHAA